MRKEEALNIFIDQGGACLRPNDWRVWIVLLHETDGVFARISSEIIAERLGLNYKTVCNAISRLQSEKLLSVYDHCFPPLYQVHPLPKHERTGQ